ncbi:unnamed protein product [Trichobilharzia szidati]|nr:unnamed protein product [Trichobilharzia szidati]
MYISSDMYATSKLIIPPKPARDSPFIPKLRIRLRHSPNNICGGHDPTLDIKHSGSPHSAGDCDDASHANIGSLLGGDPFTRLGEDSTKESNSDPLTNLSKASRQCGELSGFTSGYNMRRTTAKRKQASSFLDTLDLENPNSILTKVNLKLLINRETFFSLPVDVQQILCQLLPLFDHCKQTSSDNCVFDENDCSPSHSLSSGIELPEQSNSVWLHPTALNNEFFTKALQDFSDRQAKGEFTPRIRNRAGLRAHVGNRYRYTPFSESLQSNAHSIQNKKGANEMSAKKSPSQASLRRSSLPKSKNFDDNPSGIEPQLQNSSSALSNSAFTDNFVTSTVPSSGGIAVKNPQNKRNRNAKFSQSPSDSNNKSITVQSSPLQSKENLKNKQDCSKELNDAGVESKRNRTASPDISDLCPFPLDDMLDTEINSSVKSLDLTDLGNGECTDSVCSISEGNHGGHSLSLSPSYSGNLTSPSSFVGETSRNLTQSDKILESDSVNSKQIHLRRLSLDLKLVNSACNKQNNSNNSRSSRPSRSSNPSSSTASPSMPPPRQTKTLAAMREKLRAKRMLKETERGVMGPRFYGLPGSMTPHPASGSSGYFQSRNYSSSVNFTTLNETESKHPTCVSSSCTPMPSPVSDRNIQSVNLSSLLSDTHESAPSNLASESPCSPHSAPSIDVMSPMLSLNTTSVESSITNNSDNYTSYSNSFTQSYPSSPHLTNSNTNVILQHPISSHSPSPVHPSQLHRFEQSVSAPPTPSNPQSGQNFINYSHPLGPPFSCSGNCSSSSAPLRTSQVSPVVSVGSYPSPVFIAKSTVTSTIRSNSSVLTDSHLTHNLNNPVSSSGSPTINVNCTVSECSTVSKSVSQAFSPFVEPVTSVQATIKSVPTLDTISISPLKSVSSVTKLLTSNSRQNRSSTTTRAFFVDGDNLSEAVAFLQSLNPKATITQQQFLLIPGANKSQMFLCRAPVTCSSDIISSSASQTTVSVSHTSQTSGMSNPLLVTNSGKLNTENQPNSVCTPIVLNDIPSTSCPREKNCLPTNISVTEPCRPGSVYMTTNNDGSFPKVMKNSAELQVPRSLVYSKSINVSAPNGPSFPLNILISHPKVCETNSERPSLLHVVKSVSSSSKLTIPSSANSVSCSHHAAVPALFNYKQPVSHPQLNVSLLAPGPSVINNEVPILFVQDRNQHPVRSQTSSRPVNWVQHSSFDHHTDLTDRSSVSLPIIPTATVITTHANNTGEFRCFPRPVARSAPSMQISNNVSVSNHFGFQSIQSGQPQNPAGTSPFLSGPTATIMSPCLPAVILSHPITIQSTSNIAPCQQNIFTKSLP